MIMTIAADEIDHFLFHVEKMKFPYRMLVWIMLDAGLRLEETRSLAWCDLVYLDEPKSAIELTGSMAKGNRPRTVPVSKFLSKMIKTEWYNAKHHHTMGTSHYIACKKGNSEPVTARSIQRQVEALGKRSLFRKLTPHMLRHTFATRLLKVSNLEVVRAALGHRHLSTTQIYVHPASDDLHDAINKVDTGATYKTDPRVTESPQTPSPRTDQTPE